MDIVNEEEFCRCVEDGVENGLNLYESFIKCLDKCHGDLRSFIVRMINSCEEFEKYLRDIRNKDICTSLHHYLMYVNVKRCFKISEDILRMLRFILENVDKICNLLNDVFNIYIENVIKNSLRSSSDVVKDVEISILTDIITRLQLYCDCIRDYGYGFCINILNSVKSRIQTLL